MKLKRLEIEGGFLDGLDIAFADGLNVFVGARGSGKTSVIEVLRHCLGVGAVTKDAQIRSQEQALWVLDDGYASLTVEIDGHERTIRRGVNQDPSSEELGKSVLFVSQKEIEAIGQDINGRRLILDQYELHGSPVSVDRDNAMGSTVQQVAQRIHKLRTELDEVEQHLTPLADVPDALKDAEKELGARSTEDKELQRLEKEAHILGDGVGELAEEFRAIKSVNDRLKTWKEDLESTRRSEPNLDSIPKEFSDEVAGALVDIRADLDEGISKIEKLTGSLDAKSSELELSLNARRRELSEMNAAIEALEEGAGKFSRKVSSLREQAKQFAALEARKKSLGDEINDADQERIKALDSLSTSADERYDLRERSARALNERFGGDIKIDVIKAGDVSEYETALGRALEGSGLQWRDLARQVAQRVSPVELVFASESLDFESIAVASSISEDRAKRMLVHLAGVDTSNILLSDVNDEVTFSLVDGKMVKPTDSLSLGQRCTVVLPLLLAGDPDLAVLDQPEDHLDNAFIVDTVVEALSSQRSGSQRLVATHNANIPVLGDAAQVIVMDSSGRQAFVMERGELKDPQIVSTIERLMEGGETAFRRRAIFYGE